MGARVVPVLLLIGSNIFMTFAWYGHLKFREVPLWKVILVSAVDCVLRVLPAGAGQPAGFAGVLARPAPR